MDDTQSSAPVLTLHLLREERACPPYVCELPSQTTCSASLGLLWVGPLRVDLLDNVAASSRRQRAGLDAMTPAELARVRRRLVAFATEVFEPLARADQRRWGEVYLGGLMLDGKRKSIQPMASRLPDGNEQALQQFISQSPWDWRPVRQRLATQMTAAVDPDAWMVDDTGFPKFGNASVGVARQDSGTWARWPTARLA
jgi:hypothetical protein